MKKSNLKILNYSIAVIIGLCCVCLVLVLAVASSDSTLSIPIPASQLPELNLSTVIAQTYSAAQIQTQELFTPTPELLFTITFTPTVTMLPTATLSEFEIQTAQAWATYYANPIPTVTPLFIFPTSDGEIYVPPKIDDDVCSCSSDLYKCGDFQTRDAAQACYEYCVSKGYEDIHRLDQGGEKGVACETYEY